MRKGATKKDIEMNGTKKEITFNVMKEIPLNKFTKKIKSPSNLN